MTWRYFPFVLILIVSGAVSAWITGYAWQRRRTPGGIFFVALMGMATYWSLNYAIELSLLKPAYRIILSQVSYLAILSMGPLWLLFALEYRQKDHPFTGRRGALLWIIPAAILALVLTNGRHGLVWPSITPADDLPGALLVYEHGIGVWVTIAYEYALLAIGTVLFIRQTLKLPAIHRQRVRILIAGAVIPWLGNVLYNIGIRPEAGLDLTPILFTLTGLAFVFGIFRFHILDIVPIARGMVIENLKDGMLVLDTQDRVLDINQSACRLLGCGGAQAVGQAVGMVLQQWPALAERLGNSDQWQAEEQLPGSIWIEVNASALLDRHEQRVGRLVSLRDISVRKKAEEEARQREAIAEALRDTAAALNSALDFEQVLDNILANVQRVLPHDTANIMLIDEHRQAYMVRERGYTERGTEEQIRAFRLPVAETPCLQKMIATSQPIVVPDTRNDPNWIQVEEFAYNRSYAGIPILQKGKVVGFINLDSETPGYFTPDHIERLRVFADQAAIAIENARLFERVRENALQMTSLYEIGLSLTSTLDQEQVLRDLFAHIKIILKPDVFYIAIYDETTHLVEFPFFYDFGKTVQVPPYKITEKPGLTAEVIQTRKTLYLADLLDPETARRHPVNRHNDTPPSRTYVGVPMIVRNQMVGVISIQDYRPGMFDEGQIRLLETIAAQAAIAIQNARLYAEVQRLATMDPLTGIYNRRGLFELGQREINRALRFKRPLAALFIDIDHFKVFNDRYSYETGDRMLRAVAACLLENLRGVDLVGRYGGEEIVVLLPEIGPAGALETAERLRQAVETLCVPTEQGELAVTVSIGVVSFDSHPDGPVTKSEESLLGELIDRAGQALHLAKDRGRNRVAAPPLEEVGL